MLHAPLPADDRRTHTFLRTDVELIHQALGSGQPHTHTARGAVAILHHGIDVYNTRPLIFADNLDPFTPSALNLTHSYRAGACVKKDIARQLTDRCCDSGLIDCTKTHILRDIAGKCSGNHNIKVAADDSRLTLRHRHSPRSRAAALRDPFRG